MKSNFTPAEPPKTSDKQWTKKEVAEFFGIKVCTVDEWVRLKRIPFYRIGKTVRFSPPRIQQFVESQTVDVKAR